MSYSVIQLKMLLDISNIDERRQKFFEGIVNYLSSFSADKTKLNVDRYVDKLQNLFPQWALRFNYVNHVKYMLNLWKDDKTVDEVESILQNVEKITNIINGGYYV